MAHLNTPTQGQGTNVNIFSQIEQMMAAARTEAQTLDDMKYKLRETEELKARVESTENQISAAKEMNYGLRRTMGDLERQNAQLRNDMQSLNDIYHSEHNQFVNVQQVRGNLEQEVKRLKKELATHRSDTGKASELRSSHDSLVSESGNLKKTVESLKTSNTILNAEKEALHEVHKRDKEKWMKQISSMEEEAVRLRGVVEEGAALVEDMKVRMQYVESKSHQISDRLTMAWEDRASSEQRLCTSAMHATRENSILRRDLTMLRTEIQHLQCVSVDAETQYIAATTGLKDIIAKHENEMSNAQLKAVEMKEVVNTLKAQNQELDQEVSSLRMKHFSVVVEGRTHIAERDQLVLDVARLEAEKVQLEGVVAAVNRTAESQMDELMMHMRNMSTQNETLQSQLNDSQSKYWEEMKTFKDLEASLMSEIASLSKKSQEQLLQLQTLQSEKDTTDTTSKQEISSLSQQLLQLQQDLEKRTNDNTKLTSEKVALSDERNALAQRIEEIEETSKTYLNTVKGAFENERAKLEDEIKKRSSKLKSVDAQRQGLLKETHDLGVILASTQAEVDQLRGELALANEQLQNSKSQTDTLQTKNAELSEELKVESTRVTSTKAELTSAQHLLQKKDQQLLTVQNEASKWHQEKAQVQLRIAELSEVNEVLKAQNRESDGDIASLRSAYDATRNDLQQLSSERDQWNVVMSRLESEKAGLESKLARDTSALEGQRDDLQTRLQNAHSQCDATLAQLREMQNRHWEEMKSIKDSEATLLSEADSLTQELHEKMTLLTSLQSEKAQWEHHSKEEINRMGQMTALMTDELEKRVLELTQITTERNALVDEKQADKKRIEELETSVKTMEGTFKQTLDTDRTKLQEELRKRVAKLKTMETEKQELLQETHELSSQLGVAQRDVSSMHTQLIAATEQLKEHVHHEEMLKARNTELLEELKAASRREQDVRLELTRADERLRGEDVRVDTLIKETKKMATQQVMDVTNQLRLAQDETERLKTQCTNLEAAEKRVMSDLDRARKDIELVMASRDEMQQQNTTETTSLRKDLQEQRLKVKQVSEAKAVMEVDMVNHRMQLQKYEEELARSRDRTDALSVKLSAAMGELETGKQSAKEEIRVSKTRAEEAASKVVYLEEMLSKQRLEMERIMHDYSRAERDGFNDNLRLKTQLEAYDQEVSELRPLIPLLRKENGETKARLEKLQASSTATVNGLLDELKAAEGALSSERKKAQTDAEMHRVQLMEMQTAMERAKDNIEESVSKAKIEKADKDKRIQQLENEVERLKVISLAKEGRVDDLEKQHQDDRARLLALNLKIESAERNASDAVAALEQEKAQVERLEKKLQQQGSSSGHGHGNGGGGMGIVNRSARGSFSSMDDYRERDINVIGERSDLYSSSGNNNSSSHRYPTQYGSSSSSGPGSVTSSGLPTRSHSGSASGRAVAHIHHQTVSSHSQLSSQQQYHQPSSSSSSQQYHDNDNGNDSIGSALLPVPILPLHDHVPQGPGLAPGGHSLEHTSSSSSSSYLRHHLPPSPEGHISSSSSSMYMNDNPHHHHQQHGFGAYAAAAMSSYASLSPPRGSTLNHSHHGGNQDSDDVHPQGQEPGHQGQSIHFQSPVIDRVAQALASRAAKDRDRETIASSSGHGSNQNSSRRASDGGRRSFHEQDDIGFVGSGKGASHRPEVTEEYDGASHQAVEHSIQRTESFIKNRLRAAGAGAGTASAHSDTSTNHNHHGSSSPAMTSVPPPGVSMGMELSHPRGGGDPRVTGYGDRDDDDDDDGRSMEGYGYGNHNHNHSHQGISRQAPYGAYHGPSSSSSYKDDDNQNVAPANSVVSLKRSNSGISKPGSSSGSSKSMSVSLRSNSSPAADEERENCPPNDSTGIGPNSSTGITREHKRGLSAQSAALPKINKNSGATASGGNGSARR